MIVRSLILKKCKRIIQISDLLYYYRQHSSNISKIVEHSKDVKCLSQYYLANYIIQYAKDIDLDIDNDFKLIMLNEYSIMSYNRFKKLDKKIRKMLFHLSAKQINNLNINKKILNDFSDKYYYKAFMKENYVLYTMVSIYTKWSKRS